MSDEAIPVKQTLDGIDDVRLALERVNDLLKNSQLAWLCNFNKAYWVITKNVQQKLKSGYFADPTFLETFDVRFVEYYFDALSNYLQGKATPAAWLITFEQARSCQASSLKAMALGVNAHVNNDIAQVLADCRAEPKHHSDYNKVNKVIRQSIYEVIEGLAVDTTKINPRRKFLRPIYKFGMSLLIHLWRSTAWRKYQKLQTAHYNIHKIEQRANLLAQGTQRLPI